MSSYPDKCSGCEHLGMDSCAEGCWDVCEHSAWAKDFQGGRSFHESFICPVGKGVIKSED